jgi:hypothetical protein
LTGLEKVVEGKIENGKVDQMSRQFIYMSRLDQVVREDSDAHSKTDQQVLMYRLSRNRLSRSHRLSRF